MHKHNTINAKRRCTARNKMYFDLLCLACAPPQFIGIGLNRLAIIILIIINIFITLSKYVQTNL